MIIRVWVPFGHSWIKQPFLLKQALFLVNRLKQYKVKLVQIDNTHDKSQQHSNSRTNNHYHPKSEGVKHLWHCVAFTGNIYSPHREQCLRKNAVELFLIRPHFSSALELALQPTKKSGRDGHFHSAMSKSGLIWTAKIHQVHLSLNKLWSTFK